MKQLYKVMPMVATAVLLVAGIVLFAGCEKEKINDTTSIQGNINNTTSTQDETIVNPIVPNDTVKERLDDFFSNWNDTITAKYSDSVYIINNMNELRALVGNDINIDFSQYCLIWGKVTAYHTGYVIQNRILYDEGNDNYHYDVFLHVGNAGYNVVFNLYFWDIYPKMYFRTSLKIDKNLTIKQ